jgi:hypothetical protein
MLDPDMETEPEPDASNPEPMLDPDMETEPEPDASNNEYVHSKNW